MDALIPFKYFPDGLGPSAAGPTHNIRTWRRVWHYIAIHAAFILALTNLTDMLFTEPQRRRVLLPILRALEFFLTIQDRMLLYLAPL